MASNQRLDNQRQPGRMHGRKNSRWYRRGYKDLPHSAWGDQRQSGSGGSTKPTGVTAGTPGVFTPPGCDIPDNLAQLRALGPLGQTTAWLAGQYVNLDPSGTAYWGGTNWQLGVGVGLELDDHVVNPQNFTIADIEAWVDAHPDQADEVLAHEQARSTPRVTLVDWLQGFISHRDEGTTP